MLEAHKGLPKREFPVPGGVEFHPVDRETGVAWEHSVQGERHMEVFIRGRQPPVRQPVLKGSERIDEELESEALVDFNSPMFW
jgi:membrane carboxypeptidase/penicillin-binding protein